MNQKREFEDIHMPKNTGLGFLIANAAFVLGFALVWHIHWLAILGLFSMIALVLYRSFQQETDYIIPAKEIERLEFSRQKEAHS